MSTHPAMPLTTLYGLDQNEPPTKAQPSYDPVYRMLRPFVSLGAIFGQLPLSGLLNRSGPKGFRWCSLPEFYTLIIHASSAANYIYLFNSVHMIMTSETKNGSALDSLMVTVYLNITIAVSVLCNLIVHLRAKEMLRLYRLLQHIEKQLALAASPYDLQPLPWKSRLLSPLMILFLSFSSAMAMIVLKFAAPPNLPFIVFSFAVLNVNFATSFPFLHAASLCWAALILYGRLTSVMERVAGRHAFEDAELGRTSRITLFQVSKQEARSTLAEIEHCRRIQQLIFSLTKQISETYTPALLLITPCFFINCAFFLYQAWGILANGKDTSSAALDAIYAFNCIAPSGILGWAMDKLKSQHEKMMELVHCCRSELLTDSTAKALQLLALQLMQSDPKFSVADFFTVNRRFLLVTFGNLVTYLVILIQFR